MCFWFLINLGWNSSSTLERLKLSVFFISYLHNTSINQYDDEETEETDKTDENEQEVNIIGLSILHSIPGFYFNNQNLNQNQNEGNENENNNDNDINNDNDNDNQILDLERDQLLNFIWSLMNNA